jgi:hypothetical protein
MEQEEESKPKEEEKVG